jgi:CrcB protein
MSLIVLLAIGLVGGVGSIARFLVDGRVARSVDRVFPYGTLAVNLTGAFALGILVGASLDQDAYRIAGTGFVGAYTTFSTWALESHRLGEDGQLRVGILNFAVSLILGLAVAWAGRQLGGAL